MDIMEVAGAEVTENPHGVDAKKIYDTENAQVVHILLKPGSPVFYVLFLVIGMLLLSGASLLSRDFVP